MTQRIQPFFEYDAKDWNLFFWVWRKDLDPFSNMTERIGPFFKYDSKKWNFFFSKYDKDFFCMSPRMEFWVRVKELNFWIWLIELNFIFWIWLTELNLFWTWLKERNPLFFSDSKNWILIMTLKTQLFFSKCDSIFWRYSKNWTLFIMSSKIEHFFCNKTPRIEPFFSIWLTE